MCISQLDGSTDPDSRISKGIEGFKPIPGLQTSRHIIDTGIADPVPKAIHRIASKRKAEVERHVREPLQKGFIGPCTFPVR